MRTWCRGLGVGLSLGLGAACLSPLAYPCESHEDCDLAGQPGQCESTGGCSYPDDG